MGYKIFGGIIDRIRGIWSRFPGYRVGKIDLQDRRPKTNRIWNTQYL